MPSKKKRVASRQAQLSQRRRRERNRGGRASPVPEPGPAVAPRANRPDPDAQSGPSEAVSPAPVREQQSTVPVQQPALPRQQARGRRRGASARLEPVPTYTFLGSELRHIALVTGVIVALLVALTVVLR